MKNKPRPVFLPTLYYYLTSYDPILEGKFVDGRPVMRLNRRERTLVLRGLLHQAKEIVGTATMRQGTVPW